MEQVSLYKYLSLRGLGTRLLIFFSPDLDGVRSGVIGVLPH
jgi:hypothetical protein